ncbi:MAG: hypothetical protein U5L45_18160 [Saprospiraceae bacterium]|nr:hypothetical protein [Saprospiraceae bacterium]
MLRSQKTTPLSFFASEASNSFFTKTKHRNGQNRTDALHTLLSNNKKKSIAYLDIL